MTGPRHRGEDRALPFRWQGVDVEPYQSDAGDASFQDVSRQVLFDDSSLDYQVRFVDIEPGGYTTLERHKHPHAVVVLAGRGQGLIGDNVVDLVAHDLVEVGPWEWHQFRAAPDERLGILSVVNGNRDRPQFATEADLERLTRYPDISAFLGLPHPGSR